MTKHPKKTLRKKILASLLVGLVGVVNAVNVYASTITVANVQSTLKEAAELQLVMQKFLKCVDGFRAGTIISADDAKSGDLFASNSHTNIAVGPWIEMEIQNKEDDGEIWCDNNQASTIAKMLGQKLKINGSSVGLTGIMCDIESDKMHKGGFLAHAKTEYEYTGGQSYTTSTVVVDKNCSEDYAAAPGYTINPDGEGEAYLKKLWSKAKSENPYLVEWDNLGDYNGTNGYYLYMNDFNTFCGKGKVSDSDASGEYTDATVFTQKMKFVNTQGEITESYIKRFKGKYDSSVPGNSFVSAGKGKNCDWLINRINELSGEVQKSIFDVIETDCTNTLKPELEALKISLQEIIDNPEVTEESRNEARTQLSKANGVTSFTEATAAGGLKCVELPNGVTAEQETGTELGEGDGTGAGGTGGEAGGEEGNTPACYEGAESLGWIVCPILAKTSEAVTDMYEKIVAPFLSIDASLLSNDENGGTYTAWKIFQSFANIVFIILLLVVIFSQLTGVGIDNYGIKKILPKLIITAILINLSYIICQLVVDVSNILGYGIKSALDNAADSLGVISISVGNGGQEVSEGATAITGVIAALGLVAGGAAILTQGFAIILPLLFAVISAAIALMFTFVLLGVRQAGVVLLVALSPLAFVAYMLPNTKKLFDKWLKMFQGLLIFFPIVGLLIGGGNLASKILLKAQPDDFFVALIAMLLNVVPFFFIPTLLKGSFAAMGNLGARISGMSKGTRGWATKKARESNAYQERQARWRAGVDKDGNVTRFGRARLKIAGNNKTVKSAIARNRAAYLKQQREEGAVNNMLGTGYEAAQAKMRSDERKEALENEMTLMASTTNNYNPDDMQSQLDKLLKSDLIAGSDEERRARALMKKMATSGGYAQKKLASSMTSDSVTDANRKAISNFMAKDADVGSAVTKKNAGAAQYLRDINAGKVTSGEKFGAWKSADRLDDNGTSMGVSNAQFVATEVTSNDNDFAMQSSSAVKEALGWDGSEFNSSKSVISRERLEGMLNNDTLMKSAEVPVQEAIRQAATAQGISAREDQVLKIQRDATIAAQEQAQTLNKIQQQQQQQQQQQSTGDTVITSGPDAGKNQTPGGIIY